MNRIIVLAASAVVLLSACGDSKSSSGGQDAGTPAVKPPPLYLQDKGVQKPANYSCLGTFTDPAGPTVDTVVTMRVEDFQDNDKVQKATVTLYGSVDDAIADKAITLPQAWGYDAMGVRTTDARFVSGDGRTVMDPENPMTLLPEGAVKVFFPANTPYRVIRAVKGGRANSSGNLVETIPTIHFNIRWDDPEAVAVKLSTKQAIPGLVSVTQEDGFGILAGGVYDCDEEEVHGAVAHATGANGYNSDDTRQVFYFVDVSGSTLPTRVKKWTDEGGVFAALNVPPGPGTVVIEGVLTEGGPLTELVRATVPVVADYVSILRLMPKGM